MANYGINIDVKIKAGQLTNFNRTLDQTDDKINKVNEKLKVIHYAGPGRKINENNLL